MLITEEALARAVRRFAIKAEIPRPDISKESEAQWIRDKLFPAFYDALQQVEDVRPCFGFSLEQAADLYLSGR